LGNSNNIFLFYSTIFDYFVLFFVTNVFCVLSLFLFLFWFLSCSQSPLSPHHFCFLPSYPNLVNPFLIYIHTHFFFYSNHIIPFLFYFYLHQVFFVFYITNLLQFLYYLLHYTLLFVFIFINYKLYNSYIYHKQNNLK